jgi:archaellum component FlaC
MIDIDKVYQKVLALCNKEQRGYMTPQEFNLMADKAQLEVFDNYFHDLKTAYHKQKNQLSSAFDEIEMIQEKLHFFMKESSLSTPISSATNNVVSYPGDLYYLDTVEHATCSTCERYEVSEMTIKEINITEKNPLLKAMYPDRMVYHREDTTTSNRKIHFYPKLTSTMNPGATHRIFYRYWRKPATPNWGYVVVKKRALYNSNTNYTTHFELHASEEENLVSRILQLAGIIIMKPGIVEVGAAEKASIKAEQNN